MTSIDWLGIIVAICSIIGAFATAVRFLVKYYLAELKPNGGSSIKDRVSDMQDKMDRLEGRVDEIYRLLIKR